MLSLGGEFYNFVYNLLLNAIFALKFNIIINNTLSCQRPKGQWINPLSMSGKFFLLILEIVKLCIKKINEFIKNIIVLNQWFFFCAHINFYSDFFGLVGILV